MVTSVMDRTSIRTNDRDIDPASWESLVMALTRRQFGFGIGAAALGAVVVGCGSSSESTDGGKTRSISHAMGTSEVVINPKRVVTLDSLPIDTAVSLGFSPVGAAQAGSADTLPLYLGSALDPTEIVGSITDPSLEAILALEPDLILSNKQRHGDLYDALSAIAPTVFVASPAIDWQGSVRTFGEALNKADEANALLADLQTRADTMSARATTGRTVHLVRVVDGKLRLHGPQTFAGSVLTSAGYTIAEQPWDPKNNMSEISMEYISQIDTDQVFVANSSSAMEIPETLLVNLDVYRRGEIHMVDYRTWITGIGVTGANAILDKASTL
ncbi:iron complex transport system substrate-binding protein [Williamsia limnetica]|uniref:Iron complex transport system substrate-binding protein n=1 Tax=Williamsia limnetica TaxID=882452 RepID=A0A318RRK4_WILLI|nr:iron-siderophore ABC transporter substrate-binding protein [Williamsia limnetica]PYE20856.1 iron complex transport system substrate-binding protein [Williamsia limnetica]